jgi:Na+-driven multidrug efflux pump
MFLLIGALATFIAQTASLTAMVAHLYRRRHLRGARLIPAGLSAGA